MRRASPRPDPDRAPARLFGAAALGLAAVLAGLVAFLAVGSARFLARETLGAVLLGTRWDPFRGTYQIGLFVAGSLIVSALALILAGPLAVAVAVFVRETATRAERRVLVLFLTLAGAVPSVAYGWWGLSVIVPFVRRVSGGAGYGLLSAGLVLTVMILPTFALLAARALEAVPGAWTEAALAVGATEDQALWTVVLPAGFAGIRAAALSALARALGETMAVQMVIGGTTDAFHGLFGPGATLTTQILTDMTLIPPGSPAHGVLDLMALLLVVGLGVLTVRGGPEEGGRR